MTDEVKECADALDRLANDARFAPRASDLQSLRNSVLDIDDDSWVAIDLVSAFPADSSIALDHPATRKEHWLGIAAGVSVFLPVLWTWIGLHSATKAYGYYLEDQSEVGATFLSLWATGFDGRLSPAGRLVPLTLFSVVLVIVAILLIVGHRAVAQKNVLQEEKLGAQARATLIGTLVQAERLLNQRRADDPGHIQSMVKQSVKHLLDAHSHTQDSAEQMKLATQQSQQVLVPMLQSASQTSADLGSAAAASREATDNLSNALATTFSRLNATLNTTLQDFVQELHSRSESLTSGAQEAVAHLTVAATQAGTGIAAEIGKSQTTSQQLASQVSVLAAASQALTADTRAALDNLVATIARLGTSLSQHESALQGQVSELTAARDAIERMLRQLERTGVS